MNAASLRPALVLLAGAGLGLAAQPLGRLALAGPRLVHDAAWTVVARHAASSSPPSSSRPCSSRP